MENSDNIEKLNCIREDVKELNEEELTKYISEMYSDVCGEFGLETFEEVTLRRLFALYRPNYDALREEAIHIIDKAGECKPKEIDDFLKECIKAVKYKSREYVALEFKRRYGDEFMGRTYLKYIDREMYDLLREFSLIDELIPSYNRRKT